MNIDKSSSGRSRHGSFKRSALIEAYADWFESLSWDWWGTLTFRGRPSRASAKRRFDDWITALRQEHGCEGFAYVRVTEHGAYLNNLHFHVLIGGLERAPSILEWSRRWVRLAGECKIEQYRDGGGGISYMLKRLRPDEDFDIDIKLRSANRTCTPYDE